MPPIDGHSETLANAEADAQNWLELIEQLQEEEATRSMETYTVPELFALAHIGNPEAENVLNLRLRETGVLQENQVVSATVLGEDFYLRSVVHITDENGTLIEARTTIESVNGGVYFLSPSDYPPGHEPFVFDQPPDGERSWVITAGSLDKRTLGFFFGEDYEEWLAETDYIVFQTTGDGAFETPVQVIKRTDQGWIVKWEQQPAAMQLDNVIWGTDFTPQTPPSCIRDRRKASTHSRQFCKV